MLTLILHSKQLLSQIIYLYVMEDLTCKCVPKKLVKINKYATIHVANPFGVNNANVI